MMRNVKEWKTAQAGVRMDQRLVLPWTGAWKVAGEKHPGYGLENLPGPVHAGPSGCSKQIKFFTFFKRVLTFNTNSVSFPLERVEGCCSWGTWGLTPVTLVVDSKKWGIFPPIPGIIGAVCGWTWKNQGSCTAHSEDGGRCGFPNGSLPFYLAKITFTWNEAKYILPAGERKGLGGERERTKK